MSSEEPSREVLPGLYDVGDGFYNPRTKCVTDPATGEVLRIPTSNEEKWILECARSADVGTVGYRPDLYENWFKTRDLDKLAGRELTEDEKEILAMIWQEEGILESKGGSWRSSHERSTSLQSKVDSLREGKSTSSIWSRSTELEGAVRKLMKERSDMRFSNLSSLLQVSDPEVRDSDEYSIVKLLHDIAMSYSGQLDRILYQTPSTDHNSKDVPELRTTPSEASVSTKPFSLSYPPPATDATPQKVPRSVSGEMLFTKSPKNLESESSYVHLDIDYTNYSVSSSSGLTQD